VKILVVILLIAFTTSAQAISYSYIQDSSLTGLSPGADGLWASSDDVAVSGLGANTFGAASTSLNSAGGRAFLSGFTAITGNNFIGETQQQDFGILLEFLGVQNGFTDFIFPIPGTRNEITFNKDNQVSAYVTERDSFGNTITANIYEGYYLVAGEDPYSIFNTKVANHFNFLEGVVGTGWSVIYTGLWDFNFPAGPNIGLTGFASTSHVSYESNAAPKTNVDVPEPASIGLLGLGLIGICYARKAK